jgi:predicted helicase
VGASRPFSALITDTVPNYDLFEKGQCFPLHYYDWVGEDAALFNESDENGYTRKDAISDTTLANYRSRYGNHVEKTDIFYYVYGVLHSPEYKERFAADLKKNDPAYPDGRGLLGFSQAGRDLATWHLTYETVQPWPLDEHRAGSGGDVDLHFTKMRSARAGSVLDKTSIVYNSSLTLSGIPPEAYQYEVNGKSAIVWIMDRYQAKTDKASGIVNDPSDWATGAGEPRYIVDLVKRLVTVSVETVAIVDRLPTLRLAE